MAINRMTKKQMKAAEANEPQYNDFFTAMETGESEVTPKADTPDVAAQMDELRKRIDALTAQNEILTRMPPQQPQVQYVQVQPETQQQETIPDAILDPTNYTNFLLARADALAAARVEAYRKEQSEATSTTDAQDRLWAGFLAVDGNEAWENEPEKVQVATMKVLKKVANSGLDAHAFMYQNTDRFYADVTKELKATFGEPQAEEEDDGGEVDRTGGLASGQVAPLSAPKGAGKPLPDLNTDLVAIQRKGGWY